MKHYTITLFFDSLEDAVEAGHPDATETDDGSGRYFALLTFQCTSFGEIEENDESEWEIAV